jgi:hypothetical protein
MRNGSSHLLGIGRFMARKWQENGEMSCVGGVIVHESCLFTLGLPAT